MSKRKYRKPAEISTTAPYDATRLPIERPIAVYYRQSSEAQVGNISTTMQMVDLPAYLTRLGWSEENIIVIDDDAGISGTTKIDERPGMRRLFDLIMDCKIGAVACQDEDRLFRDLTQIQVNIFIQACLEANVRVITPSVIYDFAHTTMGAFHARQFRFKSEMSAEYITSYIKGRLQPARAKLIMSGLWAGASVPPGYIVDLRKKLADGTPNPNWRKYTPYEPFVEVINEYFRLFLLKGGNLKQTADHIRLQGPYYPDWDDLAVQKAVPEGFKLIKPYNIKRGARGYCPDKGALERMFTGAVYMGHWMTRGQVIKWNNHPPIVPEDVFMRAFNYLSSLKFDGSPNPDYVPRKRNVRPTLDDRRNEPRPLCEGLIVSCENGIWRSAGVQWSQATGRYAYSFLSREVNNPVLWYKQAFYVDEIVVHYLKSKLRATFNPDVWDAIVQTFHTDHEQERKRTLKQLAGLEKDMERLMYNLSKITNVQMIEKAQAQYEQYQLEQERLRTKVIELDKDISQRQTLIKLRDTYIPAIDNWKRLSLDEQRLVVHVFVDRIEISSLPNQAVRVLIKWRDGSSDQVDIPRKGTTYIQWLASESSQLIELLEQKASQIEIASAFPNRSWHMIRCKIYSMKSRFPTTIAPKPIQDDETYNDYLRREERIRLTGGRRQSYVRDRWQPEEVVRLNEMLDRNVSQLDLVQAFPRRNWDGIRRKITIERGKEFKVHGTGIVERFETYAQYCIRIQQQETMVVQEVPPDSVREFKIPFKWSAEETAFLNEMLDQGATQLELVKALSTRNWESIRRKISIERGKDYKAPGPHVVARNETYEDYCARQRRESEETGEDSLADMGFEDCSSMRSWRWAAI
ncbi:MAG: recombinase family protein [Anaerolinea sp.]|nr:recombinase family protein [Anaerolinea sp.]